MPLPDSARDPIESFRDAIRPAQLMVEVFVLLDSPDGPRSDDELVMKLRALIDSPVAEELLLIRNEMFIGLVREAAPLKKAQLKTASLAHLLRQAVVASATAYETYLGNLVRSHLPRVIELRGRNFLPLDDKKLKEAFKDLKFELGEVIRLLNDDPKSIALFVGNKLESHFRAGFLGKTSGVYVAGRLLGLADPWVDIAVSLQRDAVELEKHVKTTLQRRNDIVHRGDRTQEQPDVVQPITLAYAKQSVGAIDQACLALDGLVKARLKELQATTLQEQA